MRTNNREDMAERAQRSADSLASNSVLLHDLALLGSERSRSKKNAFWDGQLANVVNEAAATDSDAKILRQAQLIRHGNGVFGESFRSEEHTSELQSLTNLVCR